MIKLLLIEDENTGIEAVQNLLEQMMPNAVVQQAILQPVYKQRFLSRCHEHMKLISTSDIAYCYTENRTSYAALKNGKRYPLDLCLDNLEQSLDPACFFRINRQFILSYHAIAGLQLCARSRVLVKTEPAYKTELFVSTERAAAFRQWLSGGA